MAVNLVQVATEYDDEDLLLYAMDLDAQNAEERRGKSTFDLNFERFRLENLSDAQCLDKFRFCNDDILRLTRVLGLPAEISCRNGALITAEDALCMTLRRLAYPNRLTDLEQLFGRPASVLSLTVNKTINMIFEQHAHLLTSLNQPWLNNIHLSRYAEAIHAKGAPLSNCFGFIDGTVRPICRPTRYQRVVFNGHKRVHALKFQSLVLPNGLIGNLYGPIEGRRHDAGILRESGLHDQLIALPRTQEGEHYCLYGDPAYPMRPWLISPFRQGANNVLGHAEQEFNEAMSSVRVSVEWAFGKILQNWAFVDFKKDLKVFLQPVAKYYLVAGLLTNCHTCLYGSLTGSFFGMEPPTLEEYIG